MEILKRLKETMRQLGKIQGKFKSQPTLKTETPVSPMLVEFEQPIFLRQKSLEPVWERYPKGTMYHNLPDDEPDNDYIKFVEDVPIVIDINFISSYRLSL